MKPRNAVKDLEPDLWASGVRGGFNSGIRRRPLGRFLVLAYVFSWSYRLPVAFAGVISVAWSRLRDRHSLAGSAALLGVIWAGWHLPVFWIDIGMRNLDWFIIPGWVI